MTLSTLRISGLGLLAATLFAFAPTVAYTETPTADSAQETSEAGVHEELDKRFAERRSQLLEEAHAALDETAAALQALDEGKSQEALDALARATGKLELLVAREPELSLAPVDVDFITYDLYATPDAVRVARDRAESLLDDGRVQEARALLSSLASEIVIRVTNLPLATYPDAIKAISPLIDAGKIEEAESALSIALNTLVVTNQVVSLPVLRAQAALDEAEARLAADELSEEDKKTVDELTRAARVHLEMAELLGYGNEKEHEMFRDEIAELEGKVRDDEATEGVFAKLRKSLEQFQTSFFE